MYFDLMVRFENEQNSTRVTPNQNFSITKYMESKSINYIRRIPNKKKKKRFLKMSRTLMQRLKLQRLKSICVTLMLTVVLDKNTCFGTSFYIISI